MTTFFVFHFLMYKKLLSLYSKIKNEASYYFLRQQAVRDRFWGDRDMYMETVVYRGNRGGQGVTGADSGRRGRCTVSDRGEHRG